MKKLIEKNKNLCKSLKTLDTTHFVLKSIVKNFNFFTLVRWNAFLKLKELSKNHSKVSITTKCLFSLNKKRFNKLTGFSRQIFLKTIRFGEVHGIRKSSW